MDARKINNYIGIPFVSGGREPEKGLDCWGLCIHVMRAYGYELPDYLIDAYDTETISNQISLNKPKWEELKEPESPCIVTMRLGSANYTNHCAVYIGSGLILNTRAKTGSVFEPITRPAIKSIITGFYKPPKEYKK